MQTVVALSPFNFQPKFTQTSVYQTAVFHPSIFISPSSYRIVVFRNKSKGPRSTRVVSYSQDDVFSDYSNTQLRQTPPDGKFSDGDELELRGKPSKIFSDESAMELSNDSNEDEALAPFLKFFKDRQSLSEEEDEEEEQTKLFGLEEDVFNEKNETGVAKLEEEGERVSVEYYEPKPGDFVVGVVVSGNENKLDVNVGADLLGTMLTKEVLPLYGKELNYLLCDLRSDSEDFMVRGKRGIIKYDDALSDGPGPGRPVVETGTVLFAEVLGRTLSGRPLLSTRRLFRKIAWHRVRQIKHLNEPFEVKITEWNTGGLLTRIEGLRAFLPKAELLRRANNYTELKENVGREIQVLITRIDEDSNNLILSEREAWEMLHLREGTLLDGSVKKIFPYGAQIRIGETNRSGLLHISNISSSQITSVNDVLAVDEKVTVLVVKSMFPDKISLSIAELESEPGLLLTNKEKVFAEAEMMAKKYKQKLAANVNISKLEAPPASSIPFNSEATLYANWKWFKFEGA